MIHSYLPFDPPHQHLFQTYYAGYTQRLERVAPKVVLIAEEDPLRFFAALLASVRHKALTVIADPQWQALEWQVLFECLEPDLIFSSIAHLESLKIGLSKDYTPWQGYILLPTGGSSGKLKLAIHSWENFIVSAQATKSFLKQQHLSSLSVLPPWHISGLIDRKSVV